MSFGEDPWSAPPLVTVEQAWPLQSTLPPPELVQPDSDPTPYINAAIDIFGRAVARPVVYAPAPAPLPSWVVPVVIGAGVFFLLSMMKSNHRRRGK